MTDRQFTIASTTGVDVVLSIAGPGSRSYAFVIDWHVRLLLALAWFLCAAELAFGTLSPDAAKAHGLRYGLLVAMPALAIYFLYHPVLEIAMHGRTPGKRIAGVRLVTRSGGIPSVGALLIRNAFRLLDSLPFAYAVGLGVCFATDEHVRIGDLAAGTLLVIDEGTGGDALAHFGAAEHGLDPSMVEIVNELLRRWTELAADRRLELARAVLGRFGSPAEHDALHALGAEELRRRLQGLVAPRSGA